MGHAALETFVDWSVTKKLISEDRFHYACGQANPIESIKKMLRTHYYAAKTGKHFRPEDRRRLALSEIQESSHSPGFAPTSQLSGSSPQGLLGDAVTFVTVGVGFAVLLGLLLFGLIGYQLWKHVTKPRLQNSSEEPTGADLV